MLFYKYLRHSFAVILIWVLLSIRPVYAVDQCFAAGGGIVPALICASSLIFLKVHESGDNEFGNPQDEYNPLYLLSNEENPLHFLSDEERKIVGQNAKAMFRPFIKPIEQLLNQIKGSLEVNNPQWQNHICLDEFATRHWYALRINRQNIATCVQLMPPLNQAFLNSTLLQGLIDQIDPTLIDWSNYANKHYGKVMQNINKLFFSQRLFANGEFFQNGPKTNLGLIFDPFLAMEVRVNPKVTAETSIIPRLFKTLAHEYSAQLKGLNKVDPDKICQAMFPALPPVTAGQPVPSDVTVAADQWPRMLAANYVLHISNHACGSAARDYQSRYLQRNEGDTLLFSLLSSDQSLTGTTPRSTEVRLIKNAKALKKLRLILEIPQRIATLENKKRDLEEASQADPDDLEQSFLEQTFAQAIDQQIAALTKQFDAVKGKAFVLNKGLETVVYKLFSDGSNVKDLLKTVKDEETIVNSQIYAIRMHLYARVFTKENCAQDPKYMFTLLMDPFASHSLKKACVRHRGGLLATATAESAG